MGNNVRVLDFSANGIERLSYDELCMTLKADEYGGMKGAKVRIDHYELIARLVELFGGVLDGEIVVRRNGARVIKRLEAEYGVGSLQSHLLTNVMAKIVLPVGGNVEFYPVLGVIFNERGVSVGYGQNVRMCDNFSILSASVKQTYGAGRFSVEQLFAELSLWLNNLGMMWERDVEIIDGMKAVGMSEEGLFGLLGRMHASAVNQAYFGGSSFFNISQVSSFSRSLLSKFKLDNLGGVSIWELYNFGTEVLKPHIVDTENLFIDTYNFTQFIRQQYLDKPSPVTIQLVENVASRLITPDIGHFESHASEPVKATSAQVVDTEDVKPENESMAKFREKIEEIKKESSLVSPEELPEMIESVIAHNTPKSDLGSDIEEKKQTLAEFIGEGIEATKSSENASQPIQADIEFEDTADFMGEDPLDEDMFD